MNTVITKIRSRTPFNNKPGFTLIELLIVIGIIMTLAGLAMENYLSASIRAKVTRTKADHKTLCIAIESYYVDHQAPPRMAHRKYDDPQFDTIDEIPVSAVMSKVISTPIAYLADAYLIDPFMISRTSAPLDERLYTYQVISQYIEWNPESGFWPEAKEFYGQWRLFGVGPDQSFNHKFANSAQLPYDPTNGTISLGNICTSHFNRQELPKIPTLLGKH